MTMLSPSTKYYFAMKSVEKNRNLSGISNIATGTTSSSILSLSLTPSSGSVKRGGNISATATLANRTPISYPVSLGCNLVFAELPDSVIAFQLNKNASCSFVPSSVNPPTNSALTISTASTFPKGTYGIIILGQSINIPLTSAIFSLTVTD